MRFLLSLILLLSLAAQPSNGSEPRLKWTFTAGSNLYASPLVADMHPNPGLETLLSDSEARRLRCISADGQQLWELDGGWTLRLTTSAALTWAKDTGTPTLLIGSTDGRLICANAATGTILWKTEVGRIEWGGVLWADLDGDGDDEAIAGTESNGIHVFSREGTPRWVYPATPEQAKPLLPCPIAAADVNGDSKAEIFAVDRMGPFQLSSEGTLVWKTQTGDEFKSAPVIGDAGGDNQPELYAASIDDNALWCLDALDGHVLWKAYLLAGMESATGSSLCLGDLNKDGKEEIVLADKAGHLYCFDCKGNNQWIFQMEQPREMTPSLGDVDGDGQIEVLAAANDHMLYCLSPASELEWKVTANLRLLNAATICDVDLDGKADILVGGGDRKLRCYTLEARYRPSLVPWPSRRFDVQQTGSCFHHRESVMDMRVPVVTSLLREGGFENSKTFTWKPDSPALTELAARRQQEPRGWLLVQGEDSCWRIDKETKRSENTSLLVTPEETPVILRSEPVLVEADLRSVTPTIWIQGAPSAMVSLVWTGATGFIRQDSLTSNAAPVDGWTRYFAQAVTCPSRAKWLALMCEIPAGKGNPVHLDDACLMGYSESLRSVQPLVNQVGYDIGAPKFFTVQSNYIADKATFELIDDRGTVVFSGPLESKGRIIGNYQSDWGFFYWRGDFSSFDTPGKYRVRVHIGGTQETSWPFQVAANLLWNHTSRPAYRFFYYQRCGMEIPGFHKACHLDDAASADGSKQFNLVGGWHDAGDYNKYHNAPYVLGLATAYSLQPELFAQQDEDRNGTSDFLDEILWGAEHIQRMVREDGSVHSEITSGYGFWNAPELETDNVPRTGDERRTRGADSGGNPSQHCAALAKVARLAKRMDFAVTAEKCLHWSLEHGQKGDLELSAAIDLFVATGKKEYEDLARGIITALGPTDAGITRNYDATFHEDHATELRKRLTQEADEILTHAGNPFGVCSFGTTQQPNFFNGPAESGGWHVGTSSHLFTMATKVAQAYHYSPNPEYLRFIYDQFNWTLGNNPYDLCLMEGVGSANPPTYHNRITFGGVPRGAIPGSVVNGITWRGISDDRPYFDMSGADIPDFEPNEVWLPHNTNYLQALANMPQHGSGEK